MIVHLLLLTAFVLLVQLRVDGLLFQSYRKSNRCVTKWDVSMSPEPRGLRSRISALTIRVGRNIPSWLFRRNRSPPYKLLGTDLPLWVFQEGQPAWIREIALKPPSWMLADDIPVIITNSYKTESPPLWMLNMEKLPAWFNEVEVLPNWLLTLGEEAPPAWMLRDTIPAWLKTDVIPFADKSKI